MELWEQKLSDLLTVLRPDPSPWFPALPFSKLTHSFILPTLRKKGIKTKTGIQHRSPRQLEARRQRNSAAREYNRSSKPQKQKSLSNIDCRQEDPKGHVHQSTLLRRHTRKPSPQALQLRKQSPPNIHRPKTHYSRKFSHIHQEREEGKRRMEKAKTNLLFQARGDSQSDLQQSSCELRNPRRRCLSQVLTIYLPAEKEVYCVG